MADDVLLDVNVLVALVWPQHVHHRPAHAWLTAFDRRFATTPLTEAALVRFSLQPLVTDTVVTASEALSLLRGLRAHPQHRFLPDDSSLVANAVEVTGIVTSRQVADLHLVNLCASHGLVLLTFDRAIPAALSAADRRHVSVLSPSA